MESQHTINNKGLSSFPVDVNICGSMDSKTSATDIELKDHVTPVNDSRDKEAVSGVLPLDTETAYAKAKKILAIMFGNFFLASSAYRKKLEN